MREMLIERIEELEKELNKMEEKSDYKARIIRDITEANLNLAKRMFDEFCREIKE